MAMSPEHHAKRAEHHAGEARKHAHAARAAARMRKPEPTAEMRREDRKEAMKRKRRG